MIPFQKIFTLVVRTFSKPVLSYLKQRQQENKMVYLRWFFVRVGRRYQVFQHWLNHKILKTTHKKQMNQLKDEILLQKGIEASYEIMFYCIVIGLPMYELYTSAISAEKKEKKLNQNASSMQKDLKQLNKNLAKAVQALKHRQTEREKLIAERENLITTARKHREQKRQKQFKQYLALKQEEEHQRLTKLMGEQIKQNTTNFLEINAENNLPQSTFIADSQHHSSTDEQSTV